MQFRKKTLLERNVWKNAGSAEHKHFKDRQKFIFIWNSSWSLGPLCVLSRTERKKKSQNFLFSSRFHSKYTARVILLGWDDGITHCLHYCNTKVIQVRGFLLCIWDKYEKKMRNSEIFSSSVWFALDIFFIPYISPSDYLSIQTLWIRVIRKFRSKIMSCSSFVFRVHTAQLCFDFGRASNAALQWRFPGSCALESWEGVILLSFLCRYGHFSLFVVCCGRAI